MKKKKTKNKKNNVWRFNYKGVLFIISIVLVAAILALIYFMYTDLKKVEQGIFNLDQQLESTVEKIDYSGIGEQNAEKSLQFSEATKQWKIYQNENFHFQFKYPAGWGYFDLRDLSENDEKIFSDQRFIGNFSLLERRLKLRLSTYNMSETEEKKFANEKVNQIVKDSETGECGNELFFELESLGLGEVRNCFVRENILGQRFLVFRYYNSITEESNKVAVYPRDYFYLKLNMAEKSEAEENYFIQSIVFLN
ncbi:MAG TPA: hypothetical protein VKP03_01865 [Patescibacteria group bacterium]|nr:hypothetical protein [Patescibacteria group bacterium]